MIDTDHIFIHLAKSTLTLTPFTYDGTLHNNINMTGTAINVQAQALH